MEAKELLQEFKIFLIKQRHATNTTIKQYLKIIKEFLEIQKGVIPTTEDIESFLYQSTSEENFSKSQWNLRLSVLRTYGIFLKRKLKLSTNPAMDIDRAIIKPDEPVPLTFDEFIRILYSFDGLSSFYKARNGAIMMILFHTAMRVSELASLNLSQIDFNSRLFYGVRRKNDKVLSSPFSDIVSEYLEQYIEEREKLLQGKEEDALIISKEKRRMSVRSIQIMVKKYAKKSGILRPVTPHLLRHSSATKLIQLNIPLPVVQGILGHSSPVTTQRYIHTAEGERREAIEKFGLAFSEALGGYKD